MELRRAAGANKRIFAFAAAGSIAGTLVFVFWVLRQRDAQAPIALLYVPVVAIGSAAAGGVYGWAAIVAFRIREAKGALPLLRWLLAASIFATTTMLAFGQVAAIAEYRQLRNADADPAMLQRAYHRALAAGDYLHLAAIAANPRTPEPILRAIAASDDPAMWARRLDPRTGLLDNGYESVITRLVNNRRLPPDLLPSLARSNDEEVLASIAGNPLATPTLLKEIFQRTTSPAVRYALTTNHQTPANILDALAEYPEFRGSLAGNRSLTVATATRLRNDTDENVRWLLCFNLSVPDAILYDLTRDPAGRVREAAGQQLAARQRERRR